MLPRFAGAIVFAALLFSGCDSAPGLPDTPGRAPVVSGLAVTPDALVRNAFENGQIDGDTARIPVTISASALDPDGEIAEVQAVVLAPTSSLRPLVVVPMALSGAHYRASFTLPLPLGEVGVYAVVVVARDEAGQTGQVLGSLTYSQVNNPPVVESVAATPNPLTAGDLLTLTAHVSDPEGLANVLRVEVEAPSGDTFRLFDDGESFGDETANDGIFTAAFALLVGEETPLPADLTFVFRATDRGGLESAPVSLVVTVQ